MKKTVCPTVNKAKAGGIAKRAKRNRRKGIFRNIANQNVMAMAVAHISTKDVQSHVKRLFSFDLSEDATTEMIACIPKNMSSRSEAMGLFCCKYLVALDLFLQSGRSNQADMTKAIGKIIGRDEVSRKARLCHLDQFILGLFPIQGANLVTEALVRVGRMLVGDRYLSGGHFQAAQIVDIVLGPLSGDVCSLRAVRSGFRTMMSVQVQKLSPVRISNFVKLDHLEAAIGYKFRDQELLEDALSLLSHKTYEQGLSCQRMEFLGDAFIDTFIMEHWTRMLPNSTGSELVAIHKKSIHRGIFSAAAANICLENHLHYVDISKETAVKVMVEGLVLAKWEDKYNKVVTSYWDRVDIKNKSLCDAFESLIAAVLIDSDFDPSPVNGVLERTLRFALDTLLFEKQNPK
ncbi:Dicer-like protein 2 [Haplosporangium sp. Z 27]|nr:Dicer-like protein 2 [Haplosporangium sp. Z 27]